MYIAKLIHLINISKWVIVAYKINKKQMEKIDYNNRKFRVIGNSNVKDIGSQTIFEFCQDGDLIFGRYQGGEVRKGSFIAVMHGNGSMEKKFQHLNQRGNLVSGSSIASPEILNNGSVRLRESWEFSPEVSGSTIMEELLDEKTKDTSFNWLSYLRQQTGHHISNLLFIK